MSSFIRKYGFLILIILNILIYIPSLKSGMLLDDITLIKDDFRITNISHLPSYFPFQRPVRALTFMSDYLLYGLNKLWGFHLTNILLHILAVFLLWKVFLYLKIKIEYIFYALLLFSIHPFTMDAVYIISHRKESLMLIFILLMIYTFRDNIKYIFLFVLSYLFAIFSKETAGLFPFALYFNATSKRLKILSLIPLLGILGLLFFINRVNYDIAILRDIFLKIPFYFFNYLYKLVFPFKMFSITPYRHPMLYEIIIGYILIFVLFFLLMKTEKDKLDKILLMWIFSLYFPISGILPLSLGFGFRYMYAILPALFVFIIKRVPFFRKYLMYPFIALFAFTFFVNMNSYKNEENFWKREITNNPTPVGYTNIALYYSKIGRDDLAEEYYKKALKIAPGYFKPLNNLSTIMVKKGDYKSAAEYIKKAINVNPNVPQLYFNAGIIYYKLSKYDSAAYFYEEALKIEPNYNVALKNLILLNIQIGRKDSLKLQLKRLITIDPRQIWAYDILYKLFVKDNDTLNAKACMEYKHFYDTVWKPGMNGIPIKWN